MTATLSLAPHLSFGSQMYLYKDLFSPKKATFTSPSGYIFGGRGHRSTHYRGDGKEFHIYFMTLGSH